MNLDNLAKIDLNLLVILQVLLEELSVTRAASRLHLSQSALSKSLNRLRDTLGDPLFIRTSHGLKPTAHAMQLGHKLPNLLHDFYQLTRPPSFEPLTSNRQFSFAMVESAYETLLPYFLGPILNNAPNLKLDTYVWMEQSMTALQKGQIDFGISGRDLQPQSDLQIDNLPTGIAHKTLFTDHQICLVRENHPIITAVNSGQWDIKVYLEMSHVQVRCEGNDWWALDYYLANLGHRRRLSTTVPDFYGAASVCAHSDLIFTLPSSFARHARKLYPLVAVPLPFEFIPLAYVLLWHERNTEEPGHQWVRKTICKTVADAFIPK
ncbi:LysR family transcriptional regulator [Shewanella sp. VB17]|uniref:LysR family transcriptional regulator n=1 Tax=Shewanella sp. VB17 TaxID=2739432 RepID=UPI001565C7AA|nr:LysR family transcriptional regulator [Shewanella sp. VB17]NRD75704.1 LysR family transcriptional regulator [Shewanella sp. VB17]